MAEAYTVVNDELDSLLSEEEQKPEENRKDKGSNSRPGRLPKKELNKKLITAIVRRLRILYLDAPKKEDRILINEILDDLEQLMILNSIACELIGVDCREKE
ncbi:hypothetical protein TK0599 [Thermococcus kodakarensis KOD1]|uniref:Uncharacterized protein n=1 Tax=Thermococcus kodakarensis (strain ATCC BAA-918 / JCM 12380 / KOD1) TaxID=69014 RepID=Q5JFB6_THEKO|nr:hypothetical protein [Thermococcus kodakarensis]WCN28644.1 hypothetical protein POG15_03070 [Thermococcus kodakarensis]WCN30942.1 hypothetical protein POG21_03070 [Thermococcus kodakarensis]BAD84788.1 hypothetical protein TK0599 [Thermococcus kodakarensis KOD1]